MKFWTVKAKRRFFVKCAWLALVAACSIYRMTPAAVEANQSVPKIDGTPVASGSSDHTSNEQTSSAQNDRWAAVRAVGSTIFVVALILIGTVLMKRYMPHRFGPLGHRKRIHVLESVPLGEKRTLTLVEIDGNSLLLACSPASVSLIKEFTRSLDTGTEPNPLTDRAGNTPTSSAKKKGTELQFKQALISELSLTDGVRDSGKVLARLSQIRQALEAR